MAGAALRGLRTQARPGSGAMPMRCRRPGRDADALPLAGARCRCAAAGRGAVPMRRCPSGVGTRGFGFAGRVWGQCAAAGRGVVPMRRCPSGVGTRGFGFAGRGTVPMCCRRPGRGADVASSVGGARIRHGWSRCGVDAALSVRGSGVSGVRLRRPGHGADVLPPAGARCRCGVVRGGARIRMAGRGVRSMWRRPSGPGADPAPSVGASRPSVTTGRGLASHPPRASCPSHTSGRTIA